MRTDKTRIVYRIPGGLYGNDPGWKQDDLNYGNVVIDVRFIQDAIKWLSRRANIHNFITNPNGETNSIGIHYTLK